MTEEIGLSALLSAAAADLRRMADELQQMEAEILPVLVDHPGMCAALQPLDPLLQRACGLARVLETAAGSAPSTVVPDLAATLARLRLAQLLPGLQNRSRQEQPPRPDELFDPAA